MRAQDKSEVAYQWYSALYKSMSFVLFSDTWFQNGHSVSCVTILFSSLQITR